MYSGMLAGQRREEKRVRDASPEDKKNMKSETKPRGLRERLLDYVMKRFSSSKDEETLGEISSWCTARHRPEPPRVLERQTRFTASEIKLMYRGFKQECPTGVVDEDTFKHIFSQFFPLGDASQYAHYVFNTVKHKHSPNINFEEFLLALSRVARGSTQEKLAWVFNLYDTDGDGRISRQELADIVKAIYLLLGRATSPPCRDQDVMAHADRVFTAMDVDADGAVSREELCAWVLARPHAAAALHTLDTTLDEERPTSSSNNSSNITDVISATAELTLSNKDKSNDTSKLITSEAFSSTLNNTQFTSISTSAESTSKTPSTNISSSIMTVRSCTSSSSSSKPCGTVTPSCDTPPLSTILSPSSYCSTLPSGNTSSIAMTSQSIATAMTSTGSTDVEVTRCKRPPPVPIRRTKVTEVDATRKPRRRPRPPSPPKSQS